jgi:hypothetical protein
MFYNHTKQQAKYFLHILSIRRTHYGDTFCMFVSSQKTTERISIKLGSAELYTKHVGTFTSLDPLYVKLYRSSEKRQLVGPHNTETCNFYLKLVST